MDQPKDKTELTLLIDPKHKTEYCITNGRSYIRTRITAKGDKK